VPLCILVADVRDFEERLKEAEARKPSGSVLLRRSAPREELTVHFRLITPAIIGGANPRGPAELRLSSILGAIRFWWRALAWPRACAAVPDTGNPEQTTLERLRKVREWQMELFGGPDEDHGQGAFTAELLDVENAEPIRLACYLTGFGQVRRELPGRPGEPAKYRHNPRPGLGYLAGQGVDTRCAIQGGATFSIRFFCAREVNQGRSQHATERN